MATRLRRLTAASAEPYSPQGIDGLSRFVGIRWESAERVRIEVRPELINPAGLLSGAVTYALVDYSMGSVLWAAAQPRRADRDDQHLDQLPADRAGGRC